MATAAEIPFEVDFEVGDRAHGEVGVDHGLRAVAPEIVAARLLAVGSHFKRGVDFGPLAEGISGLEHKFHARKVAGFVGHTLAAADIGELTRTEWIEELNGFWTTSWEKWQTYWDDPTNNPEYVEVMKTNYPKFKALLERLEREVGDCQVARMNRHGGDETVWYFVKAQDSFYVIYVSDAM